ncbi:DUF3892 domain-containing protein [Microbacterium sp. 3H14]|nr:DUF3892 domain-containing protein [Microbacterium sp. 3H14]
MGAAGLGTKMSIQITHVRYGSTRKSEDEIVRYKWRSNETSESGENDKPSLVAWVEDDGKAYVGSGSGRSLVGVVKPSNGQPYLRTYADGQWNNNLLSLPTF